MTKSAPILTKLALIASLASLITAVLLLSVDMPVWAQMDTLTTPAPQQKSITLTPATAQQLTLTAIPPRLGDDSTLRAKPGEKIQIAVKVRNSSEFPLQIQSTPQDFVVDENGETPIAVTDAVSNRWSLASWIILTPATQELQAGETGIVNVIIEVPENALPGGHYAMITHQPAGAATNIQDTKSASALQQRVGTLLYLTVEGPINTLAYVRDFEIPRFSEYGPVPFSFLVDNQSDIHIRPQISVEIYNLFGKKIETIPVPTKNIFPLIGRSFEGQWDRIWGMGPYTAKVVMSYGSEGQVSMATTKFWLLPITLVAAGAIALLAIIAILIVIKRHLDYRRSQEKQQIELLEQRLHELENEPKQPNQFDT